MDSDIRKLQLGKKIKAFRKKNRLTQKQLALMVDMDRGYLSGIEAGKQNVTFDKLCKLADAFEIPLSVLMEDIDSD